MEYHVYTDGAFSFKRNQGGSSIVIVRDGQIVLSYCTKQVGGTNNTAELKAIILAMKCFKEHVDSITFYTDSQYCLDTIAGKNSVESNKDLWKLWANTYTSLKELCNNISFKWVKGHNKNFFNELADKLAVKASHAI